MTDLDRLSRDLDDLRAQIREQGYRIRELEKMREPPRFWTGGLGGGPFRTKDRAEQTAKCVWPAGCPKNSSCARNFGCMYGCKAHSSRPYAELKAEIEAETRRRAPDCPSHAEK